MVEVRSGSSTTRSSAFDLVPPDAGNRSSSAPVSTSTKMVATARANGHDADQAAEYLHIEPRLVRAALAYYADFADEVDEDQAESERANAAERARWERQQHGLG